MRLTLMSMTKAQDPSKLKMCGVNTGTELTILPAQPAQDKEAAFDLWRRANIPGIFLILEHNPGIFLIRSEGENRY